jgi:hypothetical protein
MMNGQDRKEAVPLVNDHGLTNGIDVGGDVLVGQHHPFWVSGRSGGVLDDGQVFEAHLFSWCIVFEGVKYLRKMVAPVNFLQGDEEGFSL